MSLGSMQRKGDQSSMVNDLDSYLGNPIKESCGQDAINASKETYTNKEIKCNDQLC